MDDAISNDVKKCCRMYQTGTNWLDLYRADPILQIKKNKYFLIKRQNMIKHLQLCASMFILRIISLLSEAIHQSK